MRINEIFYSIQGEGLFTGEPTAFIRLQGCNLRCTYCDTKKAQELTGGVELPPEEIVSKVVDLAGPADWVCVTGGEPLQQISELRHLVDLLHKQGYYIEIETNGSLPAPDPDSFPEIESWCADVKGPSAQVNSITHESWFLKGPEDQLKFVVSNEADLAYVEKMLIDHPYTESAILLSPVVQLLPIGTCSGKSEYYTSGAWTEACAEFCKLHNLRLSLQIHKFIWSPEREGV